MIKLSTGQWLNISQIQCVSPAGNEWRISFVAGGWMDINEAQKRELDTLLEEVCK